MADSPLELLDSLVSDLDALTFGDKGKLDALKKKSNDDSTTEDVWVDIGISGYSGGR